MQAIYLQVVVAIVSVFLISYIVKPIYIVDIFYFNGRIVNFIAGASCGLYFTVSVLIIVLPTLNSIVNFLLYMGLRKSFRRQFLALFKGCKKRGQEADVPMNTSQSQMSHTET